jgi:hypothetical protein
MIHQFVSLRVAAAPYTLIDKYLHLNPLMTQQFVSLNIATAPHMEPFNSDTIVSLRRIASLTVYIIERYCNNLYH